MTTATTATRPTFEVITRQYRVVSVPGIFSPGMIRWILAAITPSDKPKAVELLGAMGLPAEVATRVADADESIRIDFDDGAGTVTFSVRA